MGAPLLKGPFDIPDVPDFVPRHLKPWIFIFFVLIIQFSGGLYLAAATDIVGSTALMREDILMAGYAQLVGMSVNFAVMFRLKFRYGNRTGLLVCGTVLIACTLICASTRSVPVLIAACFVAGWFRMWATFVCNSTIQLWLTPVRDMAVFFCYVYLVVDGVIQLSGVFAVYTAYFWQWEYFHWVMAGLLLLMIVLTLVLVRPFRGGMPYIPLLGIDWIGAGLWSVTMLSFTFICVYGEYYDWWVAGEMKGAAAILAASLLLNLWRATFLRHPYISFEALTNRNVVRATAVYLVFFTLLATEHVAEHGYAETILGFDGTNLVDLNWYVLAGIAAGVAFTYLTFARRRWRYRSMTAAGFFLAVVYLAYFYFMIDYGVEKEMLFIPLFCRGAASVIISVVFLTSIVQSGLSFQKFPQALTVNGFTGAVMGATLGPAVVGEMLRHITARNFSQLSYAFTRTTGIAGEEVGGIMQAVRRQALAVSLKELFGWLLIAGLVALVVILCGYGGLRPHAIFPKWSSIRRVIRSGVRIYRREEAAE